MPERDPNTETITADSGGVTIGFVSADDDETVSVAFSGTGVSGETYTLEEGKVTVDFTNSNGAGWTGIPTTSTLYIGGTMSVAAGATGDTTINETITVTVTYDSIV